MKVLFEKPSAEIRDRRTTWGAKRDAWLKKAQKEEEVYYSNVDGTGTIFTKAQLERIGEGSNIPVSINFLYPIVNQKLAVLTKTKPTSKVVALDMRNKEYAAVLDKMGKSVMYNSSAVGEKEECIKNMLILGMGIDGIEELDTYQFGSFDVEYMNYHPSLIILDADCKRRSMKGQRGYFVEREVPNDIAKVKYKYIIDTINELGLNGDGPTVDIESFASSSLAQPVGQGKINESFMNKATTVCEYYELVLSTAYYLENPETKDIEIKFAENYMNDQDFILANSIDSEVNYFVKKSLYLGDWKVAEEMLPIRSHKINVKFFEWGGSPYDSYGMIHYTLGMQDASDRAIQNMLINGMLTNNAGYTSPKGGIDVNDIPKWETIGNKPGVIKEFVPTIINGMVFKPEREQIQQLSNFYPMIVEMMKSGMQFSTGVTDIVSGDPNAGIDVFSSLQQYQSAAMQRIQLAMTHINLGDEQLGNVLIDYLLANIKPEQNYIFFDDKDKLNEYSIAKDMVKNFKTARFRVLAVTAEAMPTQKLAMSIEMMNISKTVADPMDKNIYIQKAFELADMRAFDDLKDTIDVKNKLTNQVNSLQEQLDRIEEVNKQLQNRVINAELKARIVEAQTNVAVTEAQEKEKIKSNGKAEKSS